MDLTEEKKPGRFMSTIYAIGNAVGEAISSVKKLIANVNDYRKVPGLIASTKDELGRDSNLTARDSISSRSSEELDRSSMEAGQGSFSKNDEKAAALRLSLTSPVPKKTSTMKSVGKFVARKMGFGKSSGGKGL